MSLHVLVSAAVLCWVFFTTNKTAIRDNSGDRVKIGLYSQRLGINIFLPEKSAPSLSPKPCFYFYAYSPKRRINKGLLTCWFASDRTLPPCTQQVIPMSQGILTQFQKASFGVGQKLQLEEYRGGKTPPKFISSVLKLLIATCREGAPSQPAVFG